MARSDGGLGARRPRGSESRGSEGREPEGEQLEGVLPLRAGGCGASGSEGQGSDQGAWLSPVLEDLHVPRPNPDDPLVAHP